VVDEALPLAGGPLMVSAVGMGNPHLIHFTHRLWSPEETASLGRLVETHPWCPRRTNFHVAVPEGRGRVRVRHWERGSGLTDACGTGASAVLVAGVLSGRLDRAVEAHLPGGVLDLRWDERDHVMMRGPSRETASGTYWPR
jgi:diaminopimelate epimerase